MVTAIALVVAIPIGLACAIYLSEYASPRVRKTIKPVLEVLAGVPTVVFGFFALTFFTPTILRDLLHLEVGIFNALSAGIVMGIMVVPTIASVAEDSMSAVPAALREGAYGLGASKRQVAVRVVFPRRCRASSPRSSSARRAPSARRSSSSSPAARSPRTSSTSPSRWRR